MTSTRQRLGRSGIFSLLSNPVSLVMSAAAFVIGVVAELIVWRTVPVHHLPCLMALAGAAATPFGVWSIRSDLRFRLRVRWSEVWELVRFGRFVFVTNLGSMLFNRTDMMMLGSAVPSSEIAVYNVPQRIGNYVDVPLTSVASVVYPRAAATDVTDVEHLRGLYERSVGAMLAMLIPVAAIMFFGAPWIVRLAAGEYYADTAAALATVWGVVIAQIILYRMLRASFFRPWGFARGYYGQTWHYVKERARPWRRPSRKEQP